MTQLAFAGFNLESVTSVPKSSSLADFERVCTRGKGIIERFTGTNTVPGGFLKVTSEQHIGVTPLFHSLLGALGPADEEAVKAYTDELIKGLEQEPYVDGLVLFLHGACWSSGFIDIERYILDNVRAHFPDLPISVALDYHGNIDSETLRSADIAVAYRHSPHIDMGETGERATHALLRMLKTGKAPGLAVAQVGMVIPSILSATALEPLASILADAQELERDQDCYLSIMAGFAYADSPNTGMSVIAVDWKGQHAAEEKANDLAVRLFEERHAINSSLTILDIESALINVKKGHIPKRPIVLLEHADRMNDSTYLLRALLESEAGGNNLGKIMVPFLLDPYAAREAYEAGVGSEALLYIGGHSSSKSGGPIEVHAQVLWTGEKSYSVSGRYQQGSYMDLGLTALIEVGSIRISIVSYFAMAVDADPFLIFDERPEDYDIILLRSKTHFRDFYEPISDRILVVDTPDLGPADVTKIHYKQLNTSCLFPWIDIAASK